MKKQFQLETERLRLRELTIVDASFILQLMNAPNWLQYIGDRNVKTKSESANYISKKIISSYRSNGFGLYLIQIKELNKPIGICGLVQRDGLDTPDIGFAILPIYEGNGYITEAAKAVIKYSKENLLLKIIYGITTEENIASIHVLKNIGMLFSKKILLPKEKKTFMLFSTI